MADQFANLTPEERSVVNILTYGSAAARQELFVRLIYIEKLEALQKIYNAMTDVDYWKYVPLA
jgi:hypothetical protein